MASTGYTDIRYAAVDLRGDEANRLLFEAVFQNESWGDFMSDFYIDGTIPAGGSRKMLLIGEMDAPLRLSAGCNDEETATLKSSSRKLNTEIVGGLVGLCLEDYSRSIYNEMKTAGMLGLSGDARGHFIFQALLERFKQAMQKQIVANAYFGDMANGSSTFNLCDGIFSVLLPVAQGEGMPVVSGYGGSALQLGDAIEMLTEMKEAQTVELYGVADSEKWFKVSRAVMDRLTRDLRDGMKGSDLFGSIIIDGIKVPTFDGIPIKVFAEFDKLWKDVKGLDYGNLAILCANNNLQMGTDGSNPDAQLQTFYDARSNKTFARQKTSFGFNYAQAKLMVAAFNIPN